MFQILFNPPCMTHCALLKFLRCPQTDWSCFHSDHNGMTTYLKYFSSINHGMILINNAFMKITSSYKLHDSVWARIYLLENWMQNIWFSLLSANDQSESRPFVTYFVIMFCESVVKSMARWRLWSGFFNFEQVIQKQEISRKASDDKI